MTRGLFISFEGPEGSGKSTQVARLKARLIEMGYDVVCVREPGGTATGEAIRDILQHDAAGETIYPETETLLFAASRAQLVRGIITPALAEGTCVIADRFVDSTIAYQGYGRGFEPDDVMALNDFAVSGVMPGLTLLLDVTVEEGFARVATRNGERGHELDRMERAGKDFHERVRQGYLALAARWPERYVRVDGNADEDAVAATVWAAVEALMSKQQANHDEG